MEDTPYALAIRELRALDRERAADADLLARLQAAVSQDWIETHLPDLPNSAAVIRKTIHRMPFEHTMRLIHALAAE